MRSSSGGSKPLSNKMVRDFAREVWTNSGRKGSYHDLYKAFRKNPTLTAKKKRR